MADPISMQQSEQKEAPTAQINTSAVAAPASGHRAAFRELKLQLNTEELSNSGTQKCILDMLLRAEEERNEYKEFIPKFYEADKKAGILEVDLKKSKINETVFGVVVAVGGTIMGLTPFFCEKGLAYGLITLGVGLALTIGAAISRILFK